MKRIVLTLLLTVCLLLTACTALRTYTAEVTMYVNTSVSEENAGVGSFINSLTNSNEIAQSCEVIFSTRSFSKRIADASSCSADDVHSMLTVEAIENPALVRITVTGHSENTVARVAEAVAAEAAPYLKEITSLDADVCVDVVSITYPAPTE